MHYPLIVLAEAGADVRVREALDEDALSRLEEAIGLDRINPGRPSGRTARLVAEGAARRIRDGFGFAEGAEGMLSFVLSKARLLSWLDANRTLAGVLEGTPSQAVEGIQRLRAEAFQPVCLVRAAHDYKGADTVAGLLWEVMDGMDGAELAVEAVFDAMKED